MTCKYHATAPRLGGWGDCTVNNCVRLGECPSAETIVGVLRQRSQSVTPIQKEASTNRQVHKAVR